MKLFVGVTNNDWFRFLAAQQPDEVNSIMPCTGRQLTVLPARPEAQPARKFLERHNGIFKG